MQETDSGNKERVGLVKDILHTVDSFDQTVSTVVKKTESYVNPVRKNAVHRFPTVFILLTTFGVVTTLYGFERLLMQITYLNDRPLLILLVGIAVLSGTGTLYKKLK